jgi:hypothetical protein
MQLHALLVAPAELETLSREEGLRRLGQCDADLRAEFPPTDLLAATLETVRIQLEADAAGSRFPLFWSLAVALAADVVDGWDVPELDALTQELRSIETELEHLPVGLAATVILGDEGFPEIYFRVSPHLERAGIYQPASLGAMMGPVLSAVRAVAIKAMVRGLAVALVRDGVRVDYLWGVPS